MNRSKIEDLLGKTLINISRQSGDDEIHFITDKFEKYKMFHEQDCCETVLIEDICGDINDLLGSPILQAEESTSNERPNDLPKEKYPDESETWTFYKISTIKGSVTIRWHGSSNGYYSESVEFVKYSEAP